MRKYNGKWMDCFQVSIADEKDRPQVKGKILLETPHIDYYFTREQWMEFKEKINKI